MSSRGKSVTGGVTLFLGLILLNLFVTFPLIPYLLLGVLGGFIIEDQTNAFIILAGVGFFSVLAALVGMSTAAEGMALISLAIGLLNTIGIIFGGFVGLIFRDFIDVSDSNNETTTEKERW
jgi:hypothetical protein